MQRSKAAQRGEVASLVAVLAAALAVLAAGAVTASRLTSAYWVQLIFSTSPLFTALLSASFLHLPLPPRLWETLSLTVFGSGGR